MSTTSTRPTNLSTRHPLLHPSRTVISTSPSQRSSHTLLTSEPEGRIDTMAPSDFLAYLDECVATTQQCSSSLSTTITKLHPGVEDLPRLTKILRNKHVGESLDLSRHDLSLARRPMRYSACLQTTGNGSRGEGKRRYPLGRCGLY